MLLEGGAKNNEESTNHACLQPRESFANALREMKAIQRKTAGKSSIRHKVRANAPKGAHQPIELRGHDGCSGLAKPRGPAS